MGGPDQSGFRRCLVTLVMSYVIRQALRQHIHTGGTGFLFRDDVGQGQTQGQTAAVEAVQLPQGKASAAAKPELKKLTKRSWSRPWRAGQVHNKKGGFR